MSYDGMNMEELTEQQDKFIVDSGDMKNAVEDIKRALNNLKDVEDDVINNIYEELDGILNVIEDKIADFDGEVDEIDYHLRILESAYDEYGERQREYKKMQGF